DADLGFSRIEAGSLADLDIGGAATGTELIADQVRIEAGSADLQAVTAHDDARISTDADLALGRVISGNGQTLTAGGTLTAGTLDAGSFLLLEAGAIDLGSGRAGTTATLKSVGDTVIGSL